MHICGLSCYVLMHEYVVQYWIQGKMNFLESLSIMVKTIKFSFIFKYIVHYSSLQPFFFLLSYCNFVLINKLFLIPLRSLIWEPILFTNSVSSTFFWFCTSEIMQYVIILGLFHGWSSVSTILAQMMGFHSYLWLNAILLYKHAPVFVH